MYYRYMRVEDVENMFIERYYNSEYSNLPDINIIKNVDGEFGINLEDNEFINQCLHDCCIERRIIKLHSLPKKIFEHMMPKKTYGIVDCVYGNIINNHFVYIMPYSDNSSRPLFDYNYIPIVYFKDYDISPYCDDADIIYSYDRIIELPLYQRLLLFYKYY